MSAVARYTLLELSRRRLLLALIVVSIGLVAAQGLAPYVLPGITTPAERADFLMNGLVRSIGLFVLLTGFAIGMTVIYNDLDSGAAVAIFAKPLSRFAYAAAKAGVAVTVQALVAVALAATTVAILLLYGGGDYDYTAVITFFAAAAANTVALVLVLMTLTTVLHNIVAAVAGFVVYEVFGAITSLHDFVLQGTPIASPWRELINIGYPLVPHQLVGGLAREVIRHEVDAGQFAAFMAQHPDYDPYRGVPYPSSLADIASWAAYCIVIAVLLYMAIRRRQV